MKKSFLTAGFFFLVFLTATPSKASAAIAFDTSAYLGSITGTTLSASYTASPDNPLLLVFVQGSTDTDNITSVTANGLSMTRIENPIFQGRWCYLYYITGISGTFNIVVTNSGVGDQFMQAYVASYKGVSQTGPESSVSATQSTATLNATLTTITDGSWQMGVFGGLGYTLNSITNGTFREPGGTNDQQTFDSNGPKSPAGNITFTGNYAASADHLAIVASFAPAVVVHQVTGSGIVNNLAKFTTSSSISNALLSDDGANTVLTSGNLFLPAGSSLDSSLAGALNFGTATATTMRFGRSGQSLVIDSNVGIATDTPTTKLFVNGDLFANWIKVAANSFGIDTLTPGTLYLGSTTANSIKIGRIGITTTIDGTTTVASLKTTSNCVSTASPAVCGSAPSGSVALATGGSTLVVNTTAVTANSQILITQDSSLGTRLGITCNTSATNVFSVNARVAGTSFTIKSSANPAGNKACLSYWIIN